MAEDNPIPTIDLSPLRGGSERDRREVARKIDVACMDTGFFMVVGHGVPQDLVMTARQRAVRQGPTWLLPTGRYADGYVERLPPLDGAVAHGKAIVTYGRTPRRRPQSVENDLRPGRWQ